jgi:hypothetical protein
MKRNPEIQAELKSLGSSLAGTEPVNIFRVPDGYFDTVAYDVLLAVSPVSEEKTGAVPAGYFDQLANNILNKIRSSEAEEPAFTPHLPRTNVFRVPEGYFESLASDIVSSVKLEREADPVLSPDLNSLKQHSTYQVPEQYFSHLPSVILNRIREEEGREYLPEPLSSVKNKNPFTIPEGYFESLSFIINQKPDISGSAKVVRMSSHRSIIKYAVAAVLTGLLGLGIFSRFSSSESGNQPTTLVMNENVMKNAESIIKKDNFDEVLASLKDEEIVKYLESNGENVEVALVASVAENKNLPEPIDYMLDDQTLDHLLDVVAENNNNTN